MSGSTRLRVAYVYRHFNDNGSLTTFYRQRAERLALDEDVTLFTAASTRASTVAPLSFQTVEPMVTSGRRLPYALECASFARRATRLLRSRRQQFDVVTVDGFAATEADLALVHAVRPAEIAEYFDTVEPQAHVRRRLTPVLRPQTAVVLVVERRLFRRPFPLCLVPSARIAADLGRHYGVPDDLIEVLPYGLDLDSFRFDAGARDRERAAARVDDDRMVLLFVGSDFARKGLATAISSLAEAPGALLWVAGDGDEGAFRRQAAQLGVERRVRFLGHVDAAALAALYSAADVIVLPSRQDAWGQPVLEAMAAGRVVIASERAGAHEVIERGESGFVLSGSGAAGEIAAILAGPLSARETRERLGQRAEYLARPFDSELVYARFRAAHHRAAAIRAARLKPV